MDNESPSSLRSSFHRLEQIQVQPTTQTRGEHIDPALLEAVSGQLVHAADAIAQLTLSALQFHIGDQVSSVAWGQVGRDRKIALP